MITKVTSVSPYFNSVVTSFQYKFHSCTCSVLIRPAPNVLETVPIILSRISQKMLLIILFLFSYLTDYSRVVT